MAPRVGDYVQTVRKLGPHVPKGARGTVIRKAGGEVHEPTYRVTSYEGPTFWATADELTVLVKGNA